MLECGICHHTFPANPQDLKGGLNTEPEIPWRSPISGCHGFVSFVDDEEKSFYGCGETGEVWFSEESFFKGIDVIIEQYKHRAQFYEKRDNKWFPASNEPQDIDSLIDSENKYWLDDA